MSVSSNKRARSPISTSSPKKSKHKADRLERDFFKVPANVLAENLLGKLLVRKLEDGTIVKGRIIETECYPGVDSKGSTTYQVRRTHANEPLFMDPGTVFVYLTYGTYNCMSISSEEPGGSVLIRTLEPISGLYKMRELRMAKTRSGRFINNGSLCAGPIKLCISLNIERVFCNKLDLAQSDLMWLEKDPSYNDKDEQIVRTTRIGIKEADEKPYRFYIYRNPYVRNVDIEKERGFLRHGLSLY